jgi:hypothetical protein
MAVAQKLGFNTADAVFADATVCSWQSLGAARSLSSGRASRGPGGAFAHATLAGNLINDWAAWLKTPHG